MLKTKQNRAANQMDNNNEPSPYLPKLTELYLCENCGADYESLDEVMVRSEMNVYTKLNKPKLFRNSRLIPLIYQLYSS